MNSLSNPITTQLGDQGLGQQPWWVEQWMELINGYHFKKRLERAPKPHPYTLLGAFRGLI